LSLYLAFQVIPFFFKTPLRCSGKGIRTVNAVNTSHIYKCYAFRSAWFALLTTSKTLTMELFSMAWYFATRVADSSSLHYLYTVYFN